MVQRSVGSVEEKARRARLLVGHAASAVLMTMWGLGCAHGGPGQTRFTIREATRDHGRLPSSVIVRVDGARVGAAQHLERGQHAVTVWLADAAASGDPNLPTIVSTSARVRIDDDAAELAISVRCDAEGCEARFDARENVVVLGSVTTRRFRFETPAIAWLRQQVDEALEDGDRGRSECIRAELDGLAQFELDRDLDPASDDWSRRKAALALVTAQACTNDYAAPSSDPLCESDPSTCVERLVGEQMKQL